MNKMNKTLKSSTIIVLVIAIVAVIYVINFRVLTNTPVFASSPTPTATPTQIPTADNVTLSGLIISYGLTIPPTEVQFINTQTHEVYKAPINQLNYSYAIILPVNQTYGIEGNWNGRTFNATGIPMGAITMQLYGGGWILNLYNVTSTSITQNLQVGTPASA
jgi:TRAP-type C4-dicarboxylate transport system permease small subunit